MCYILSFIGNICLVSINKPCNTVCSLFSRTNFLWHVTVTLTAKQFSEQISQTSCVYLICFMHQCNSIVKIWERNSAEMPKMSKKTATKRITESFNLERWLYGKCGWIRTRCYIWLLSVHDSIIDDEKCMLKHSKQVFQERWSKTGKIEKLQRNEEVGIFHIKHEISCRNTVMRLK